MAHLQRMITEYQAPLKVGMGILILCVFFVAKMRDIGIKKYDLPFFRSKQFFRLSIGAFFIVVLLFNEINPVKVSFSYNVGALVLYAAIFSFWAIDGYNNIKQSNVLFGISYTFAQIIAMILLMLMLLIITCGTVILYNS